MAEQLGITCPCLGCSGVQDASSAFCSAGGKEQGHGKEEVTPRVTTVTPSQWPLGRRRPPHQRALAAAVETPMLITSMEQQLLSPRRCLGRPQLQGPWGCRRHAEDSTAPHQHCFLHTLLSWATCSGEDPHAVTSLRATNPTAPVTLVLQ